MKGLQKIMLPTFRGEQNLQKANYWRSAVEDMSLIGHILAKQQQDAQMEAVGCQIRHV